MEKRKPGRPSTNDSRRNEILEKAAKCFTQYGYDKATLDDIGELIGFNKAALYYYFKNKEELFLQVFNTEIHRGLSDLILKNEAIKDIETKILNYFRNRTDIFITLFDMHSLSKDNIINLTNSFFNKFNPYNEKEMIYISQLLNELNPKLQLSERDEYTKMLFHVTTSVTLSGIISNDIGKNKELLTILKDKKEIILKHLLNSFSK